MPYGQGGKNSLSKTRVNKATEGEQAMGEITREEEVRIKEGRLFLSIHPCHVLGLTEQS